jgi:hypothetical protein
LIGFQGIMSLARIIKWDVDPTGALDRPLSPEEIMDKLEQRVGPEGRRLFEQFLRKVNKLQAQQQQQQRTVSPSRAARGDAIERALAVAARCRRRALPA